MIGQPQRHQRARRSLVLPLFQQECPRPLVVVNGFLVGVGQAGLITGAQQVLRRLLRQRLVQLLSLLEVEGQFAGHGLCLCAVQSLHGLPDQTMGALPSLARDAGVQRFLDLVMGEAVVASHGPRALINQPVAQQSIHCLQCVFLTPAPDRVEQVKVELTTEHRCHAHGLLRVIL